jgi:hypothetical protein
MGIDRVHERTDFGDFALIGAEQFLEERHTDSDS